MYVQKNNPIKKKQKGGGTRKTCLPADKIASMSKSERQRLVSAKQKSGKAGKYRRSSKTNVKGARKKALHYVIGFKKKTGDKLIILKRNAVKNKNSGFKMKSPIKCWKGYRRKPGTTRFSKGSCVKIGKKK